MSAIEDVRKAVEFLCQKQDNEYKSLDWNLGFNEACKLILLHIALAEGTEEPK